MPFIIPKCQFDTLEYLNFVNKKQDFNDNSFPVTRIGLFKKIFLSRIGKLILVNVLCFVFFIPLLTWDLFTTMYKSNIEDISSLTNFVITIESPIKIVTYVVAFLGLAGEIYYIRKLSWGEPVSLFRTFFKGVKESYKQFIFFGIITSIFCCLFELAIQFLQFVEYSPL